MKFWHLDKPRYSDYRDSFVNGILEHPYGLPGIVCDVCGTTWGGSRVLPVECPASLRKHKHLLKRWPIPRAEHEALQALVLTEFEKTGVTGLKLKAGDSFQPCFLDIPSRPRADFLWQPYGRILVSARVREALLQLQGSGLTFWPVTLRKVGRREAKIRTPMPRIGEPEDIMEESPLLADHESVGPYFEMLVEPQSKLPPHRASLTRCRGCGWVKSDVEESGYVMNESLWPGLDIFGLAEVYAVIVTDRIRDTLRKIKATNVGFEPCESAYTFFPGRH